MNKKCRITDKCCLTDWLLLSKNNQSTCYAHSQICFFLQNARFQPLAVPEDPADVRERMLENFETMQKTCASKLPGDRGWLCRFCGCVRKTIASVRNHISSRHLPRPVVAPAADEIYCCHYCSAEFETHSLFFDHEDKCVAYAQFLKKKENDASRTAQK